MNKREGFGCLGAGEGGVVDLSRLFPLPGTLGIESKRVLSNGVQKCWSGTQLVLA